MDYSGPVGSGLGLMDVPDYGVKLGEFVIQPRFFVEGTWQSNFLRVDTRTTGQSGETGVFALHLRPGLAVFNPTYDIVAVALGIDADVFVPLTSDKDLLSHTNVGIRAHGSATFFPKGVMSFSLVERFDRQIYTSPSQIRSHANVNRNSLGADVSLHPGGRAIDVSVGYRWLIDRFDEIKRLDHDTHRFTLNGSWRFYPNTYVFVQGAFDLSSWSHKASAAEKAAIGNYVPGMPLKVYAGLSGYVTDRLSLLVRLGYGNSLLDQKRQAPPDFSSFVGQVQGSYKFTPRTMLHLGAMRDFDLVALGGYRAFWRAFLSFEQQIADIALVHLDFQYDRRDYGRWDPAQNPNMPTVTISRTHRNRQDDALRAGALVDFNIVQMFGISLGYRYEGVLTDFATIATNSDPAAATPTATTYHGYHDHRVFLSANLRY